MSSPMPKPVGELTPAKIPSSERTPSPQMMTANVQHMAVTPDMMQQMQHMQAGAHAHGMYGQSAAMCPCPTCEYYRAAMMYYSEAASPDIHSYHMYQNPYAYMGTPTTAPSPNAAAAAAAAAPMPSVSATPSHSSRGNSPVNAMPNASTLETFEKSVGKLAEVCTTSQGRAMLQSIMNLQHIDKIELIFEELLASLSTVVLDQHGCHVVRSLIEVLDDAQLKRFIDALDDELVVNMCTMSQYTRRVLQAMFERHKSPDLQVVVNVMQRNAQYLSATQQGCISLMRVFEQCSVNQKMQLVEPLLPMFADLACDPFGNYVVQCVVENSAKNIAAKIVLDAFPSSMLKMACNKFASNVMEKIISNVNVPHVRRVLLDELIFNPAALQQLVHDSYGNFVIQAIIDTCNHAGEFKKISDRLRSALPNSPFGHKIETKMRNKRFANAAGNVTNNAGNNNNNRYKAAHQRPVPAF